MTLKDAIVVITGASCGLGKALAELFVKEGGRVVASSRPSPELDRVGATLGVSTFPADVTDEKQVQALGDFTLEKFGRIDVWVNNAGIWLPRTPIEDLDSKKVHELFEVNFFGTFYGSRVALLTMKKQGNGTILNVISSSALQGRPLSAGYCASKFAADGFTKSLRLETQPFNISVISVYPYGMKTELFGENKPTGFDTYMESEVVAERIIENVKLQTSQDELIINLESRN